MAISKADAIRLATHILDPASARIFTNPDPKRRLTPPLCEQLLIALGCSEIPSEKFTDYQINRALASTGTFYTHDAFLQQGASKKLLSIFVPDRGQKFENASGLKDFLTELKSRNWPDSRFTKPAQPSNTGGRQRGSDVREYSPADLAAIMDNL